VKTSKHPKQTISFDFSYFLELPVFLVWIITQTIKRQRQCWYIKEANEKSFINAHLHSVHSSNIMCKQRINCNYGYIVMYFDSILVQVKINGDFFFCHWVYILKEKFQENIEKKVRNSMCRDILFVIFWDFFCYILLQMILVEILFLLVLCFWWLHIIFLTKMFKNIPVDES
jgi:hypothetical protein